MNSIQTQRKNNGLENAAVRMFQTNRINPESSRGIRDLAAAEESMNNAEKVSSIMGRKRFDNILIELPSGVFWSLNYWNFNNILFYVLQIP